MILVFLGAGGFALLLAFLCVFLPGLFKARGDLIGMVVHIDHPAFLVVVTPTELSEVPREHRNVRS